NTSAIKPQRRIERRGNRNRFFPLRSMRSMRFILFGDLQFGLHSAKMKSTRSAISWLVNPSSSPFRHERLYRGMHLRDLRTRDDYLDAEGLTNRDAAGGFVHDQAGVAGPLLGIDDVTKVVRWNFAVGVQDIDQQLLFPAASRAGQIRPDGESIAAEAVAGLTM